MKVLSSKFWFWGGVVAFLASASMLMVLGFYFEGPMKDHFTTMPHAQATPQHQGVYLEHAWVDGPRGDAFAVLTARLRQAHMTDVFVHVGPLSANGTIAPERYLYASTFVDMLQEALPDLRIHAWVGQVERAWGGPLDLRNPDVQANIVKTSQILIEEGFDGIHLNIEPVFDGSTAFLNLLAAMQPLRKQGALVGVALDDVEPLPFARLVGILYGRRISFIRPEYIEQMQPLVDHVAIMTYDSGMPAPHYYSYYVALQIQRLAKISIPVFVGIPSYEQGTEQFSPQVENLYQGILGIKRGMELIPQASHIGVAVYAYWETDQQEWEDFFTFWIGDGKESLDSQ